MRAGVSIGTVSTVLSRLSFASGPGRDRVIEEISTLAFELVDTCRGFRLGRERMLRLAIVDIALGAGREPRFEGVEIIRDHNGEDPADEQQTLGRLSQMIVQ